MHDVRSDSKIAVPCIRSSLFMNVWYYLPVSGSLAVSSWKNRDEPMKADADVFAPVFLYFHSVFLH